jgi:anti-sigma B factor antagonist
MTINKSLNDAKLSLELVGRLDTTTAPALENEINQSIDGVKELEFDFEQLEYISSAGLRILLGAQKTMNKQGTMVIRNVSEVVMEIFEMTGFSDILTIE